MKKLLFSLLLVISLLTLVVAVEIPTYRQNQTINLTTVCDNCTQVNLTSVSYPNSSYAMLGTFPMTKNGTNYYYTFKNTTALGTYQFVTCGDLNGVLTCDDTEGNQFLISPSGQSGNSNIVFFIFIIFAIYGLNFLAFKNGDGWMTILSGMALIALGVYMIRNGIIIYRDWITNYFAYITMGWGAYSTLIAAFSIMDEI